VAPAHYPATEHALSARITPPPPHPSKTFGGLWCLETGDSAPMMIDRYLCCVTVRLGGCEDGFRHYSCACRRRIAGVR